MTELGWLTSAVFAGFMLDWLAVWFDWHKIKPFSKPLAMVMVILWTFTAAPMPSDVLIILILSAQGLGLIGDVLLLFRDQWFIWGLGAFLMGHLVYLTALALRFSDVFDRGQLESHLRWWVIAILVGWGIILGTFYFVLGLDSWNKNMSHHLWIAIQVYAWILSGMVAFSFLTVLILPAGSKSIIFLPMGSVLFMVSDGLLTYDRFVRKLPQGQFWVRATYHLAQFSLAVGFLAVSGV